MATTVAGLAGVGYTDFGTVLTPNFAHVIVTATGLMDFEVDPPGGRVGHLGYWCYAELDPDSAEIPTGVYKGPIHWIDFRQAGVIDDHPLFAQGVTGIFHNFQPGVVVDMRFYP